MQHSDPPTGKSDLAITKPVPKPARDEIARKANALYNKAGRPQGHAQRNWQEAEAEMSGHGSEEHKGHGDHHAHLAGQ